MNKYDSFSISHLMVYISEMKRQSNSDILWWDELKEILELCNLKTFVEKKT